MTQTTKPSKLAVTAKAMVMPGPKRFCLAPVTRQANCRWTFSVRYFDEKKGRTVTEDYSADTRVEIENRLTGVAQRIRGRGFVLCDCGCEFMKINHRKDPPFFCTERKDHE